MAAHDAGKMILFIRSIAWDLGIPQEAATVLYEDNDMCTAMGNAHKLTPDLSRRLGYKLTGFDEERKA